jgi:amphiphysin
VSGLDDLVSTVNPSLSAKLVQSNRALNPSAAGSSLGRSVSSTTTSSASSLASRNLPPPSRAASSASAYKKPPPPPAPYGSKPELKDGPPPMAPPPPYSPGGGALNGGAIQKKPPPPPPLKPKPKVEPPVQYVVALYDFDAQADGDLDFKAGDRIEVVLRTASAEDWWTGKLNGRQGVFPGRFFIFHRNSKINFKITGNYVQDT